MATGQFDDAREKLLFIVNFYPLSNSAAEARRLLGELNLDEILSTDVMEGKSVHTVVSGDSFLKIANKYDTTLDCIMHLNGLQRLDRLHPGDELVVNLGIGKALAILDAELNPLAILHDENLGLAQSPVMWDRSFDKRTLVVGDTRAQFHLDFIRKPFLVPVTAKIAAGVLLALILLGAAYRLGLAKAKGAKN